MFIYHVLLLVTRTRATVFVFIRALKITNTSHGAPYRYENGLVTLQCLAQRNASAYNEDLRIEKKSEPLTIACTSDELLKNTKAALSSFGAIELSKATNRGEII